MQLLKNLEKLKTKQQELQAFNKLFLGINTGFRLLNNLINGIEPEFYLFAAATAMGKSSFLSQLAWNMVFLNEECSCVFFSLDHHSIDITAKMVSIISGVPVDYIRKPFPIKESLDSKRLEGIKTLGDFSERLIVEDQSSDIYVEDLQKYCEDSGCNTVIIDPLSKLKTYQEFSSYEEKVSYICNYLKDFSLKCNIPVIAATNLPGDAETRRPEKKDLISIPSLFYEPFCVFSLYCDYVNNQNTPFLEWLWDDESLSDDEAMVPIAELNIMKHKLSNIRERIFLKYYAGCSFYEECADSENENYNSMIKNILEYNEKKENEEKQFWKNIAESKKNYMDSAG